MKKHYRPRFKISFQSKNKVFLYKNSKFRRYYNVRDPIYIRRYFKYRKTLRLRNMKWTVARRFMNPVLKKKQFSRYQYGNSLKTKQQLKHFYGKLKEKQLQRLFKMSWLSKQQFRQDAFLGALEHRLDILLFRMRVLPTIFACKQYILHKGIYVNNEKMTLPNYQAKIGDIISLDQNEWNLFYERLVNKARIRLIGHEITKSNERYKQNESKIILHKFVRNRMRINLKLLDELDVLKKDYKQIQYIFLNYVLKSNQNNPLSLELLKFLKFLNKKIKKVQKTLPFLRIWTSKKYVTGELYVLLNYILIKFYLEQCKLFLNKIIQLQKNDKTNLSTLNTKFLVQENKLYKNSLKQLEQQILVTLRGYFLVPELIERKLLRKTRQRQLRKQKRKANVWWLDKDVMNERKSKNKWWWESKPHWYVPSYLEVDYKTLRVGIIANPNNTNVFYPFHCSFNQVISFYTDKGF